MLGNLNSIVAMIVGACFSKHRERHTGCMITDRIGEGSVNTTHLLEGNRKFQGTNVGDVNSGVGGDSQCCGILRMKISGTIPAATDAIICLDFVGHI